MIFLRVLSYLFYKCLVLFFFILHLVIILNQKIVEKIFISLFDKPILMKMLFQSLKFSKTWIVFTILFISCSISIAQQGSTIAEKTKGMKLYNGFINYYWDESTGKIWLQIDELDKEILYQTSLPAGLGSNDIGLD